MKIFRIILLVASMLSITHSFSQSNISINDPRNGGLWAKGNITKASVTITPQGDYFYYDLELEFTSGKISTAKESYDSLEISCNFNLPSGSFIKSASLLINNEWVDAKLMPRKEAHAIYEGLVKRRIDPLIIYKNYGDNYLFKIFPLNPQSSRTMKMTYAISSNSLNGNKSAGLPMDIVKASETPVDLKVSIKKSTDFPNPQFVGLTNVNFKESENGEYLEAVIPASSTISNIISSKESSSTQFSSSKNQNDITYKFSFKATDEFTLEDPKKYLFIVDNNPLIIDDTIYKYNYNENGVYTKVFSHIKKVNPLENEMVYTEIAHMLSISNEGDLFNIVLKNNDVYTYASNWTLITPQNIQDAINKLKVEDNTYKSDIKSLLNSCKTQIDESGVVSILLSNSKEYISKDYAFVRNVVDDLSNSLIFTNPVFIWDISSVVNSSSEYYWYSNNFISQLAYKLNKGNYYSSFKINYRTDFVSNFKSIQTNNLTKLLLLNVTTYSDSGIVYDRSISAPNNMIPSNEYTEFGKCSEGTKFFADISFRYKGKHYMKKLEFPISQIENSILGDAWAVEIVGDLNNSYSTDANNEATKISSEYSILTQNTSFLALEPGVEVTPCYDCPDWNGVPLWDWRWNSPIAFDGMAITEVGSMNEISTTNQLVSSPTSTNSSNSNNGVNYFEIGYEAGITEGSVKCNEFLEEAYKQGYNVGLQDGLLVGDKTIKAYPTTFSTEITIEIDSEKSEIIEIYDAAGQLIESFTITKTVKLTSLNSTIYTLPNGTYVIKANVNGVSKYKTIMKQ